MVGNLAGTVVGGEEIYEIIGIIITGDKWYGIDTPGMEQMNDAVDAILKSGSSMRDFFGGACDILKNGGDLGEYLRNHSGELLGNIKSIATAAVTYLPGLPANNLETYLLGAFKWISPEIAEAYEGLFSDAGKSDLSGLEGEALTCRLSDILNQRNLTDADETVDSLAALYREGYTGAIPGDIPTSISIDDGNRNLGAFQQQAYGNIWNSIVADGMDEMISSEMFIEADSATKEKMLKNLYDYASNIAKAELFDDYELPSATADNAEIISSGASVAECMLWNSMTSGMKDEEKAEWLAQWGIPEQAKQMIFKHKISDSKSETIDAFKAAGHSFDDFLRSYGKYEDYVLDGMEPDVAEDFYEELEQLVPADGEDDISNLQKWRASVDFSDNVEDQLIALSMVMTEAQIQKVEIAYSFGIKPDGYVTLQEIKPKYDADGNGSYKQSEITDAINAMPGNYTTEQKAVLWQLDSKSTDASKNPYNRSVGQSVLDAKEKAKENAEKEESEKSQRGGFYDFSKEQSQSDGPTSFSQEVMNQIMRNM